jgi:hypothetical protein
MTNGVSDGYKVCVMGDGAMNTWNQLITVWRQNKAFDASGQAITGKTADGSTVRYDFEGSTNSWTSTATLSSSADRSQTGSKSLKGDYSGGSATIRLASPTGLSVAAGSTVRIYFSLSRDTNVSSISAWVKNAAGTVTQASDSISRHLKGSWNVVNITVPSGSSATQVGIDFATGGAFTAHIDGVTW